MPRAKKPPFSVCVLTYGDNYHLAHRCIESVRRHTDRSLYRLIVGANAVASKTQHYLERLKKEGAIDRLLISRRNLNKNPMMRRMFEGIDTELICWFDDDSYLTEPDALLFYLDKARRSTSQTVQWGRLSVCLTPQSFINISDPTRFVRSASWYRGLPPPSWEPGGKGEFNFKGRNKGDGRWLFATGGFWVARTKALQKLDWPDPRLIKLGEDAFLGEAIRQQGWTIENTAEKGVSISEAPRRGDDGPLAD